MVELDDSPQSRLSTPAHQEQSFEYREFIEHFEKLPPRDRDVISMVAVEGLKYAEAAELLDIPVGTVRSRLSRARERLKAMSETGAGAIEADAA